MRAFECLPACPHTQAHSSDRRLLQQEETECVGHGVCFSPEIGFLLCVRVGKGLTSHVPSSLPPWFVCGLQPCF